MKTSQWFALSAYWLLAVCSVTAAHDSWTLHEQGTLQRTIPVSTRFGLLVVDNLEGYVHVTGTSQSQVEITAHQTIDAHTDADLQLAKKDVKLNITPSGNAVTVRYDAPWRCHQDEHDCDWSDHRGYNVRYDVDVRVPSGAGTTLSTVNGGDVRVAGTTGSFTVHNVNGGIEMTDISGSGDAQTVNGPVSVHFTRNPLGPGTYKTINGKLDFYFQPSFEADLLLKTFNGAIYSDFEVAGRPMPQPVLERQNGRFLYRRDGVHAARVGAGGPELSFDVLNGDIYLHRSNKD